MDEEKPFDVVLDDQLKCTYVPKVSDADRDTAIKLREARQFRDRWTEKGGVGRYDDESDKEDEEDDDIGARFRDDGRYLANANRDINRLLDNVRLILAQQPNAPDLPTGHKMVLLDRARRVAFGYVKPRPRTLAGGLDGGVNVCIYQRRRVRPGENDPLSLQKSFHKKPVARTSIVPRHRADVGTFCVGVLPNQFSKARVPRQTSGVTKRPWMAKTNDRNVRLQQLLARYTIREPVISSVGTDVHQN